MFWACIDQNVGTSHCFRIPESPNHARFQSFGTKILGPLMVFVSQSQQTMKGPNVLGLYIPKDQHIETSEHSKLRFQAQARSTQELDSDRRTRKHVSSVRRECSIRNRPRHLRLRRAARGTHRVGATNRNIAGRNLL